MGIRMKTMENELERLDEKLYRKYHMSLETAMMEWLPNVKPNKDSFNSLPHIRGVMGQIDRLLYDESGCTISLNGSEIYVLLCSVLLHDIGKGTDSKAEDAKFGSDHAADSQEVIIKHWAELGLASLRVAKIVGEVCRFHDCPNESETKELYSEYYVEQFDSIRGRMLGALLFLADHLDNSIKRTVQSYLKDRTPYEVVGRFRSRIVDIRPDKCNKMVRVILDKSEFSDDELNGRDKLYGDLQSYLLKGRATYHGKLADESVLHTIARNTMENDKQIIFIKDELNIMGMPMKKWLIECDEQLFQIFEKKDGSDKKILYSIHALEPLLNLDYCMEVLRGICVLSGGIFAKPYHKYSELVNFIREEKKKEYKVRCAVRRLSILLKTEEDNHYSIYFDDNVWKFSCGLENETLGDQDYKIIVFNQLKKLIGRKVEG